MEPYCAHEEAETEVSSGEIVALERPLYSIGEAARLLEVPAPTLRRWVDGHVGKKGLTPPVIREDRTGSDAVTWGEFVEAGFLREYRKERVSLQHLRPFIARWRQERRVAYPLADLKPQVDRVRRQLMLELQQLQDEVGLDTSLALVQGVSGQLEWREPMLAFLDKVEFDPGGARRYRPLGNADPVVIDPEVAFGIPQVRGVRTEVIAEAIAGGEQYEAVEEAYRLSRAEVRAAVRWELRLQGHPRSAAA